MFSKPKRISRRRFLARSFQAAVGVFAAASLSSCTFLQAGPTGKPGSKIQFGLVTYQLAETWDLPTLISNCEKTKVLGVELRNTHAHGVEPTLNDQQRRDVKKRFEDSPVKLLGLGGKLVLDAPDPAGLKKDIETIKSYIVLSHDVGGGGMRIMPNKFHDGVPHEKTIEQIGKSLNELGQFAADHGQQMRLEVHGDMAELPTFKSIMDIATHPNVFVCWNSNPDDLKGKGLEYNFNLVKDRFGSTAHVQPLDSANYPCQELLRLFVKADYNGWLCLEGGGKAQDRVKMLADQRVLFDKMLVIAQASV